jgi:hypothetical protein
MRIGILKKAADKGELFIGIFFTSKRAVFELFRFFKVKFQFWLRKTPNVYATYKAQ